MINDYMSYLRNEDSFIQKGTIFYGTAGTCFQEGYRYKVEKVRIEFGDIRGITARKVDENGRYYRDESSIDCCDSCSSNYSYLQIVSGASLNPSEPESKTEGLILVILGFFVIRWLEKRKAKKEIKKTRKTKTKKQII